MPVRPARSRSRPHILECHRWARGLARCASSKIDKGLLDGAELAACFLISFGREDIDANHGIGMLELSGGLELVTINLQGLDQGGRGKMGSEGERQPEQGGQLRLNRLEPRSQIGTGCRCPEQLDFCPG